MMSSHASNTVGIKRMPVADLSFVSSSALVSNAPIRCSDSVHIGRGRFLRNDVVEFKAALAAFKLQTNTSQHSRTTGADKKSQLGLTKTRERRRNMGSEGDGSLRKPRFLCLHGFRTSGKIMKTQVGKWPESVLQRLDLVYLDGPFPAQGKSDVDGIFDPPYYEWFQFNKEFTEYTNFDKCLEFIEDYMIKHGPFDGLLGFSQGAILSGGLPGLQAKGVAFTKVPKIKFLIIIGGAKFTSPAVADNAYASPIQCPSLHFLGEMDFLKPYGLELLEHCVDSTVIHHPKGHTVPRLDEQGLQTMMSFIDKIQKTISDDNAA